MVASLYINAYATQATVRVPGDYATIAAAISGVSNGDIILVTSAYSGNECVTVNKSVILAAATTAPTVKGFLVTADNVTIDKFEITDQELTNCSNGWGIYATTSNSSFTRNTIDHTTNGGIKLYATTSSPTLSTNDTISNNTITLVGSVGIQLNGRNHTAQYNDISHILQYPTWTGGVWPPHPNAYAFDVHGSGHQILSNYMHLISFADTPVTAQAQNTNPNIACFSTYSTGSVETASSDSFLHNVCNLPYYSPTYSPTYVAEMARVSNSSNLLFQDNLAVVGRGMDIVNSSGINVQQDTIVGITADPNSLGLNIGANGLVNMTLTVLSTFPNVAWQFADYTAGKIENNNCIFVTNQPSDADFTDIKADPLFTNAAGGNYTLKSNSPCLNKGAQSVTLLQAPTVPATAVPTNSPTPVNTATATPTFTATFTATATAPSATPTATHTVTPTATSLQCPTVISTYSSGALATPGLIIWICGK